MKAERSLPLVLLVALSLVALCLTGSGSAGTALAQFTSTATTIVLASAPAVSFPDVPASHPYYRAIMDLAGRQIIQGYSNGNFGPDDPVTRQQFAKMIVLTGGYEVSAADVCPFPDVDKSIPPDLFPDHYVAVAAAHGITKGTCATTFSPGANISRYQVISMVVRCADHLHPGLLAQPLSSYPDIYGWGGDPTHGPNARRAQCNGLLAGLPLWELDPWGNMTRGEVAQILFQLANPFQAAVWATPGAPASEETIVVKVGGESWVVPAAVCLRTQGDADIVLAASQQQVATVHSLVARLISGWPTTTAPHPDWDQATYERDLRVAGVTAVTLAGLAGEQAALEQAWVNYEQSFANPAQGFSAPWEISSRAEGWKVTAQALTQAIAARCSTDSTTSTSEIGNLD